MRFVLGCLVSVRSGNTGWRMCEMWAHKTKSYKPQEVSEKKCSFYNVGRQTLQILAKEPAELKMNK